MLTRMRTAKGSGLLAGVLALILGLYLPLHLLWVFILISVGLWRLSPPLPTLNALVFADMIVYIVLAVGMIRDRRGFFLLAPLWTILGSALAVVSGSYKIPLLSLLSFLVVFSSTYYYVTKTDARAFRDTRLAAGLLSLLQVFLMILSFFVLFLWFRLAVLTSLFGLLFYSSLVGRVVIYLVLGAGILRDNRKYLFYAVLWTVLESALIVAYPRYFLRDALSNLISMLILFLSAYTYWARTREAPGPLLQLP